MSVRDEYIMTLKSDVGLLHKYNEIWKHGCSNHLTRKQQHTCMPMRWQNKTKQDLSKSTVF
jgi:hypothetical protein